MKTMTMKRIKRSSVLLAMGALLCAGTADAQIMSRGDLFGPGAPPPMIGLEVGLGKHAQQGMYQAKCNCEFQNGTGSGFLGNLVFELPLDYEWALGLKAGIDFKNTESTTPIVDSAVIQYADQTKNDTVAGVHLNRVGVIKATYFGVSPFVQYQFFRMGPFLQAGPEISFLVANHFTHHRELTSDLTLADGTPIPDARFSNGTREEDVEDDQITDVSGLRLGVLLSAGYNIGVSERSVLTPMLSYDFPISTLRDTRATGWKIGSLYASVVLKFKLD